jgi:hypothetical protein
MQAGEVGAARLRVVLVYGLGDDGFGGRQDAFGARIALLRQEGRDIVSGLLQDFQQAENAASLDAEFFRNVINPRRTAVSALGKFCHKTMAEGRFGPLCVRVAQFVDRVGWWQNADIGPELDASRFG